MLFSPVWALFGSYKPVQANRGRKFDFGQTYQLRLETSLIISKST